MEVGNRKDYDPLIAGNAYELEITRLSNRPDLTPPLRSSLFSVIKLANIQDMYWNFNYVSLFREEVQLLSYLHVAFYWFIATIVAIAFMCQMIHKIGYNGFIYTTPLYIILMFSLFMKFSLVISKLDFSTRLLFLSKSEIWFIHSMTLAFIFLTSVPYDYFTGQNSREESNHNHNSIWREKMVFIAFNSTGCFFVISYIFVFLTSLMKERKTFKINFGTIYNGEVRRPQSERPSDELLVAFLQADEVFMSNFEVIIAIDVFLAMAFTCLLIFTMYRDGTVGPVDTCMSFTMAYQFIVPFVEFCEINRIDKTVALKFDFKNLCGSRYNNLTIYEINIILGIMVSLIGVLIKALGY